MMVQAVTLLDMEE